MQGSASNMCNGLGFWKLEMSAHLRFGVFKQGKKSGQHPLNTSGVEGRKQLIASKDATIFHETDWSKDLYFPVWDWSHSFYPIAITTISFWNYKPALPISLGINKPIFLSLKMVSTSNSSAFIAEQYDRCTLWQFNTQRWGILWIFTILRSF